MAEMVTLQLPTEIVQRAKDVAQRTGRHMEDILSEWLARYVDDIPVDQLSDEAILDLSDSQLPPKLQAELSDLLADNQENQLDERRRQRLEELMQVYRHGLVRKSQALKVAVERGLRPPLS